MWGQSLYIYSLCAQLTTFWNSFFYFWRKTLFLAARCYLLVSL